ncbi:MAG: hypothetical protein JXR56_02955 [Candidatus Cloacimonetes bacterium]|nr:hypothetical protein [Candidatus Cloacimonadota bacterium]
MLLLLSFVCVTALGQNPVDEPKGTTEEEYNYLTKGYKIQLESGLDMKKGYIIKDMGEWEEGSHGFKFKVLIREEADELAGILVIAKSDSWTGVSTYYLCIPINNPDLMKRYHESLSSISFISTSYAKVLSVYYAQTLFTATEMAKEMEE